MPVARYDVLDLKYSDGSPGVLRHIDGSGFAYYPSGRKAICISSHGKDGKGFSRRFSAIIHGDSQRAPILGIFDEWGRGYADGQMNHGDLQPPKVVINESMISVVDGCGMITDVPLGSRLASSKTLLPQQSAGSADVALRVNTCVTMEHRLGRTTLHFRSGEVKHSFLIGELQGEEVQGMGKSQSTGALADHTMLQLNDATQKLATMRDKVSSLKVDPSQKDTKPTFTVDVKSFKDVLDNLPTLGKSLSHPNLARPDLSWSTEGGLRKLLSAAHPECRGPPEHKKWSIAKFSGKCTDERLKHTKATVATPKSLTQVSQLKLPELIDETASKGILLVVICLATYALEQSGYAKLVAEKAHRELCSKFGKEDEDGHVSQPPFRLVTVEMSEIGGFAEQYGVKEVPYCLMFQGGQVVYSKRLSGMRHVVRDGPTNVRIRVLLLESNPTNQLKLERALRRNGCSTDLAFDVCQGLKLSAGRSYGILLVSALLPVHDLRAVVAGVRRQNPNVLVLTFDGALPLPEGGDLDDGEARGRFLESCDHVFPYVPSYTAVASALARFEVLSKTTSKANGDHKKDFVDEVLCVLDSKRTVST